MQRDRPVMRGVNAREHNRERLASLGTMAAGLAHELNNPAAAARRAAARSRRRARRHRHALRGVRRERDRARGRRASCSRSSRRRSSGPPAREPLGALDAADAEDAMLDCSRTSAIDGGLALRRAARAPPASTRTGSTASPSDRRQGQARRCAGWPRRCRRGSWRPSCMDSTERMCDLVDGDQDLRLHGPRRLVEVDLHEGIETHAR